MADQPIRDLQTADPLRSVLEGRLTREGVTIGITLWMNPRSFRWAIDVQDAAGRPLIQGHALVAQADVFAPYRPFWPDLLPPGQLFAVPVNLDGSDPVGFQAWRETHQLRYRPEADVA